MASIYMHLFIAQEYLKKNNNKENENEFIGGNIAPDLVDDKPKSHYGSTTAKPNLRVFLKNNNVNNSYYRGYFLHLLTDYLFYNYLIDIDKVVEQIGVEEWKRKLYKDYNSINSKIAKKINIETPEEIKKYVVSEDEATELFQEQDLFDFLINIASINIDEMIKQIQEEKDVDIITLFRRVIKEEQER